MIIGIDHGFYNMKTANHIFTSGITKSPYAPPVQDNVLKYNGAYYLVGGKRLKFNPDKERNEDYFILTLAAIAKELSSRKDLVVSNQPTVTLAVGTPFRRLGAEKDELRKYLLQKRNLSFEFEQKPYSIKIKDVEVYPQGLAAATWYLKENPTVNLSGLSVIADLGGGTFDLIPLINGKPGNMQDATSENFGMIRIINRVKDEVETVRKFGLDDAQIEQLIIDPGYVMPEKYKETAAKTLKECADQVTGKLIEAGFNPETTKVIWAGGGNSLIKNYGTYDKDMAIFIDDIKANVKGYEILSDLVHRKRGKN